jgi:hypothetical protein
MRPLQNNHSTAFFESDQSHQGPVRRGVSSASAAAVSGPWSVMRAKTASTRSGRSRWTLTMLPQASAAARSIRQRSKGWVATGSSEASCPQYSKSLRGARCDASSSNRRG